MGEYTCCLCGVEDESKTEICRLGLNNYPIQYDACDGTSNVNYFSFCKACWHSRNLGKKISRMLGYDAKRFI